MSTGFFCIFCFCLPNTICQKLLVLFVRYTFYLAIPRVFLLTYELRTYHGNDHKQIYNFRGENKRHFFSILLNILANYVQFSLLSRVVVVVVVVHGYYSYIIKHENYSTKNWMIFRRICISHWFHETKRQRANSIFIEEFTQLIRPKKCRVFKYVLSLSRICRLFEVELWIEMQDKNLMIYDCQWLTFRERLSISLYLSFSVYVCDRKFSVHIWYRIENGVHWPHRVRNAHIKDNNRALWTILNI